MRARPNIWENGTSDVISGDYEWDKAYYENHLSVEWARITKSLPCTLWLGILIKFLSHMLKVYYNDRNNGKTHFQNLSLFSLAIRKTSFEETCEASPFSTDVLYNLHSQLFSESFSTIIAPSICSQFWQYLLRIWTIYKLMSQFPRIFIVKTHYKNKTQETMLA